MKNADSNIRRIECTELVEIQNDINKYNEGLVESAIKNIQPQECQKNANDEIMKKQVIALTEDNIRTTDRNKIIQITIKFYNALYKTPVTKDDEERVTIANPQKFS